MGQGSLRTASFAIAASLVLGGAPKAYAADEIPSEFRGNWATGPKSCQTGPRLHVERDKILLIHGRDAASYGDIGIAYSFFGPDYRGIQVAMMPEVSSDYPFMVTFNYQEKRGVASVAIYHEIKGNVIPAVAAIQAKSKALAERFPLDGLVLTKCGRAAP